MDAEPTDHLGYGRGEAPLGGGGNARDGVSEKTIHTERGRCGSSSRVTSWQLRAADRAKHQRRFAGFDERIIAKYARGMSVRDIQAHLRALYGVEVGSDVISRVTDAVLDDVRA